MYALAAILIELISPLPPRSTFFPTSREKIFSERYKEQRAARFSSFFFFEMEGGGNLRFIGARGIFENSARSEFLQHESCIYRETRKCPFNTAFCYFRAVKCVYPTLYLRKERIGWHLKMMLSHYYRVNNRFGDSTISCALLKWRENGDNERNTNARLKSGGYDFITLLWFYFFTRIRSI